ncbi:hypothetical protein [Nocardioides marmorisolisilvae]|nr:hypothetical protein [Nocardioides marmorisolisilvae]
MAQNPEGSSRTFLGLAQPGFQTLTNAVADPDGPIPVQQAAMR